MGRNSRRPNIVILECFICQWEGNEMGRWERWDSGEVAKREIWRDGEVVRW